MGIRIKPKTKTRAKGVFESFTHLHLTSDSCMNFFGLLFFGTGGQSLPANEKTQKQHEP
jgi:hypothetical protein